MENSSVSQLKAALGFRIIPGYKSGFPLFSVEWELGWRASRPQRGQ